MKTKPADSATPWVDPDDAPELTEEFFERAEYRVADQVVSREAFKAAVRQRGRPAGSTKADAKQAVNLRLDPDVLAVLRATGAGWQTRVNTILRERFAL